MYYTFLEYTPRECQKPTAHHYLNPPLRTNLPAGLHAYISRHTTPPPPFLSPIRQLGTPGPYWISQNSATRLFPVQFLPFDYHQPHELIIPSVRILVKDREVAEGIPQHIVSCKLLLLHACFVIAHQGDESAHVPSGLVWFPACLHFRV